jgi:hypothetical protein
MHSPCTACILVEQLFIQSAFHQSGFFIEAAFHQSSFSSKQFFIKYLHVDSMKKLL